MSQKDNSDSDALTNTSGSVKRALKERTPNKSNSSSKKNDRSKKRDLTPSRNINYSGVGCGDRFIPNRGATEFDFASHCIVKRNSENQSPLKTSTDSDSPKTVEKSAKIKMMRAKSATDVEGERILCYKKGQAPPPPIGYLHHPKVLYTATAVAPSQGVKKSGRHIPSTPERILDAPNFIDDYYLNLLHWGESNIIAVALTNSLYLWNAGSGEITTLFELPRNSDLHITSVRWANEGSFLATGLSDGQLKLFDPTRRNTALRTMQSQITRVGCLAWRQHVLSAGCRSGRIYHHDVRVSTHYLTMFDKHTQEVCGLLWSDNGQYLASGAGDSVVNIWDPACLASHGSAPMHSFSDHLASVKALAFNPHQAHSLASAGGTADRSIKFWNLVAGTLCHSEQTDSQVNAMAFTPHYKELITAHGYPCNGLNIWKYPSMKVVQTLTGHTERVLALSMSPCGQYVMSASGDESLRLWWCFRVDKSCKEKVATKGPTFAESVR